jgi:hypothetical protein
MAVPAGHALLMAVLLLSVVWYGHVEGFARAAGAAGAAVGAVAWSWWENPSAS